MAGVAFSQALRDAFRRAGLDQAALARALHVSRRTLSRWTTGERVPNEKDFRSIVAAVHSRDPKIAEELAAARGTSLVALHLVAPPKQQPTRASAATVAAVDAVLCSAAEVLDASPRALRPALVAALERMKTLELTVDAALSVLAPARARPPAAEKG